VQLLYTAPAWRPSALRTPRPGESVRGDAAPELVPA